MMKKRVFGLAVAVMVIVAGLVSCSKQEGGSAVSGSSGSGAAAKSSGKASPASDFDVKLDNDTVTITGYTGKGGKVVIPSEIEGFPVTAIAREAFAVSLLNFDTSRKDAFGAFPRYEVKREHNGANITSIVIPNSVKTIGNLSFRYCANLETVDLPDGIQIGVNAFAYCSHLSLKTQARLKELGYE
jgi:hypothetical protein